MLNRSGVTITASYALRQSSRLLKVCELALFPQTLLLLTATKTVDNSNEREELQDLQERLDSKIKVCFEYFSTLF